MGKITTLAMFSTALVAFASAAHSQDVNSMGKTDFYAGVLGGFGGGTSTVFEASGGSFGQTLNPTELGVVAGVRFNHNDWLLGAEADINANLNNSFNVGTNISEFSEADGNGHLRALLGRQMGPVSIFLTGGLAGTHVKYNNINNGVDDKIMVGWTAGIGAEFAASDNISLRLEGLHDETSSSFSDGYNGKWVENTVRLGAIFKF